MIYYCNVNALSVFFSGMDIINDVLEVAVNEKDKNEWTPVSVNVAPATLTILSRQVTDDKVNMTWDTGRVTMLIVH